MTDDLYFGELPCAPLVPENNLSLSQDHYLQDHNIQDSNAPVKPPHHGQKAVTEMLIGPWYLDEFGNPTREIRARD